MANICKASYGLQRTFTSILWIAKNIHIHPLSIKMFAEELWISEWAQGLKWKLDVCTSIFSNSLNIQEGNFMVLAHGWPASLVELSSCLDSSFLMLILPSIHPVASHGVVNLHLRFNHASVSDYQHEVGKIISLGFSICMWKRGKLD